MEAAALSVLLAHQAGILNPLVDAIIPVRMPILANPSSLETLYFFCLFFKEAVHDFVRTSVMTQSPLSRCLLSFYIFILLGPEGNKRSIEEMSGFFKILLSSSSVPPSQSGAYLLPVMLLLKLGFFWYP